MNIKSTIYVVIVLLVGISFGRYWGASSMHSSRMHTEHQGEEMMDREHFVEMKNHMIGEMLADEDYKCCLDKPCVYCIEKSPGHGEGATCKCLEDVMNGRHPCGECIGEILEGHGNRFISKYFASAIAEEVGEEYIDTIKSIIANKYGISIEEQI